MRSFGPTVCIEAVELSNDNDWPRQRALQSHNLPASAARWAIVHASVEAALIAAMLICGFLIVIGSAGKVVRAMNGERRAATVGGVAVRRHELFPAAKKILQILKSKPPSARQYNGGFLLANRFSCPPFGVIGRIKLILIHII